MMGTPHVLSLAPLIGSLELIQRAGIERIRRKSLALTAFLRDEITSRCCDMQAVTPSEETRYGGHLAVRHPFAKRLSQALRRRGVICDFRHPDLIRLAPSPLTTTFAECGRAIDILCEVLATRSYEELDIHHERVT